MLRLERLGEAKAIAQLASVIGRSFSHQLLAADCERARQRTSNPLSRRLLESGLIRLEHEMTTKRSTTFKHALVRDVAYYSLLKRQRRELHARRRRRDRTPPAGDRQQRAGLPRAAPVGSGTHPARGADAGSRRQRNRPNARQIWRPSRNSTRRWRRSSSCPPDSSATIWSSNAQIALIGPTIALQGFAAVAVADVSRRAIELCRALDDDPRIFPALYARWSYLRVRRQRATRPVRWRRTI